MRTAEDEDAAEGHAPAGKACPATCAGRSSGSRLVANGSAKEQFAIDSRTAGKPPADLGEVAEELLKILARALQTPGGAK